ncbi:MAG TPA: FtsX-like permease family protein [Stellaceae bacterium]|nr:FtsX-like permease family protein [Stellaceae bacterium]
MPLALRNLLANKRRLLRSSAGIGFAVLLMLVQLGFERGFFDASLATVRQFDGDLFIMNADKYRVATRDPFPAGDLASARNVAGVLSVSPLYAAWQEFFWQPPGEDQPYLVQAFAFDPDHPVFLLPEVKAASARLKAADAVLVDRRARGFLGMASGAGEAKLNGHTVHIVGSFALGPDFMTDGTVMMSAATYARLLPGRGGAAAAAPVEFGVVEARPGADLAVVERALQAALPAGLRVLTKAQLVEFERSFEADLSSAGPIFWLGTVVGFVVGLLISYQIIYTDLSDQLPQYATLKGMGYNNGYLVRVVLGQAALSALAGYVPAWLLCLVVYRAIGAVALLPLHMTLSLTLLSFALTLGMCLLSASLAIRRVIAADPAEIF